MLVDGCAVKDSLRTEPGKVEFMREPQEQFGEVAPDCMALLEPMPGEAVGQVEAG